MIKGEGDDMGRAMIWVSSATKRKRHEEKTPEKYTKCENEQGQIKAL
jgi:hypothetical protein